MDTVPYLSVCLNTLNLPTILQNESNPVTKFLSGLSVIPSHMKLSNGYTLHQHLELLVAANPAQKYLLNKQGYTFDEIKSELLKFQKSGGYIELRDEYKAVGTDFSKPHKYLQASVEEKTATPTAQPALELKEALPDKLLEPEAPAPSTSQPEVEQKTATVSPTEPKPSIIHRTVYTPPTPSPEPETPPTPTPAIKSQPVQTRVLKTALPIATVTLAPAATTKQTLVPPPVIMTPSVNSDRAFRSVRPLTIPQPVQGGLKSVGSKAGILTQRAANVTIPNLVGGLVKDTASSLFGFIPGSRNSSPGLVSRGITYLRGGRSSGGSGRGGFISQFLPTSGGGKKSLLWILLIIFFVLFILYFFFGGPMDQLSDKADIKNIEITKIAPQAVDNGAKITYNISVRNKGAAPARVVVTDDIPQNTTYDSGNNDPVASDSGKVVKNLRWTINNLPGGQTSALSFSVYPTKDDTWIINQAKANVSVSGKGGSGTFTPSGKGLLCVDDVDPRLVEFFESAGVSAGVAPAILYGIAKGENGGSVEPWSIDGRQHAISPCGAHGLMQIEHPNDGSGKNYSASCGGGALPEVWGELHDKYNDQSGGNIVDADADKDSIFGSAFYVKQRSWPDGKSVTDQLTDAEVVKISTSYLGELNASYAQQYINGYHNAYAKQNTCKQ